MTAKSSCSISVCSRAAAGDAPALDLDRIRRWGREFADLKEDPELLRPFEDALHKAQAT
jgi:hypothetical protein